MVIFILLVSCSALEISTDSLSVTKNGRVVPEWNPDYTEGYTCHPVNSHIERSSTDSREFTFSNTSPEEVTLSFERPSSGWMMSPEFNESFPVKIEGNSSKTLVLSYNCRETSEDAWGIIQLFFIIDGIEQSIAYTKVCNVEDSGKFDWSMFILLLISVVTAGISAWSVKVITVAGIVPDEANTLTTWHAFGFLICGSTALILMFLFLQYISILLLLMIAIGGTVSMIYTFKFFTRSLPADSVNIPIGGETPVKIVIAIVLSIGIMVGYLWSRNWILNDIIGVCYCFMIIRSFKIVNFKVGALLMGLLFVYDIFWVFYSASVFGSNVMVTVATGLDLPIKLVFPHLGNYPIQHTCGLIGLGDIAIPGLFIAFASRIDAIHYASYFWTQMLCYVLALVACMSVLVIFNHAQPALLYISPFLCFGLLAHALQRKELKLLWIGLTRDISEEIALREFS